MRRATAAARERALAAQPRRASVIDDFVGELRPPRKVNAKAQLARARAELEELKASGEWTRATPRVFVALYAWLHEHVYGVAAAELESDAFMGAVSAASRMLRDEFKGDATAFVEFIRWTWKREREAEKRRRVEGHDGRRIGWKLQFVMRHLVTDYRLARARANGHARASS